MFKRLKLMGTPQTQTCFHTRFHKEKYVLFSFYEVKGIMDTRIHLERKKD